MILLRLITWQYVRKHMFRTLLTLMGIVLGVAVFVGMHTANQSVMSALHQTIDRIAGATQLQVTAGETGFDESVLDRVQATPGVRVAVPVIEAVVNTGIRGEGNLLVLGVDMLGDRSLRTYDLQGDDDGAIDDPLVFLAQPDSLMVAQSFAVRNHLKINSRITLSTMNGPRLFTIRGIMRTGGLTSAFGGNLAVMDIYAAEKMFGRGRKFDRIDLAVNDGVSIESVQRELERRLGPGFQVETPSSRGQQFEAISAVYRMSANITSLFALFIGMFLIYNAFAIAVTQRRSEIGILRALGATQLQIRMLFLGESAVAGLVASIVGVLAGIAIARAMAGYIGGMLGAVYGIAERAQEVSASPRLMVLAIAIGTVTSIVAALIPARDAARVDPVKALQKGRYQTLGEGENRLRRIAAAVCALLAAGCPFLQREGAILYAGYLLTILAALLLTPSVGLWLSRLLRPAWRWLRPVEGTLAADSLIQAPRRTSGTVAALMLSIALVIALGGMARASYSSIIQWMNIALNPDLFVTTSQSLTVRTYRFPPSVGEALRKLPGIAQVQFVRDARIVFRHRPIMLVAAGVRGLSHRARLPALEGDTAEMYRLTGAGKGVIVSDNLATLEHLHLHDIISLPTPAGLLRLPIAGIVIDYSDQQGSILIERHLFEKYWNDDSVNLFRIYLQPGASEPVVRQEILDRLGSTTRLFVLTNRDVRRYVLTLTNQWFGLTYVQIAVAVLIAVLGIINTLTVSITDRRRELGVLQAVGAVRRQIRGTVWIESLSIGFLGLVLGLGLGAVQLYYALEISWRDIAGLRLNYEYPFTIALYLLPMILGAALIAALGPAEAAVHGSLVEALEYE
jgi:putative ABC transport system permease protein